MASGDGVAAPVAVPEGEPLPVPEADVLGVPLGVPLAVAVAVTDSEADCEAGGVWLRVLVAGGVPEPVVDGSLLADRVALIVLLPVNDAVPVCVGDTPGVDAAEVVPVTLAVVEGDAVLVVVAAAVPELVVVVDSVRVGDTDRDVVGVPVRGGVVLGVQVAVGVGVACSG